MRFHRHPLQIHVSTLDYSRGSVRTREMQVADAKLGARDMYRQVNLASSAQVLDIAISAMLRASWDGSGTLLANLGLDRFICRTGVDICGQRWERHFTVKLVRLDKLTLTLVPGCKDFWGRSAAEDTWVNEASEFDVRDVTRGAVDAFEIPDCLGSELQLVHILELGTT